MLPVQTKKILILGSGSILTHALVDLWSEMYELTIAFSGKISQQDFKKENITYANLESIFSSDNIFSHVVVISAYIPEKKSLDNKKLFDINVLFVEKVVRYFANSRIIFCSSISIYQPQDATLIAEDDLVFPQSEYAISKLWAEHIIKKGSNNYAIFRISSLTGKRMKQNTLVPILVRQAKEKNCMTLFGNGERLQNYIHVSDVAQMINSCLDLSGNVTYLAVNPVSYTNNQIASVVGNFIPGTAILHSGEDKSKGYSFNAKKTYDTLNYRPTKDLTFMIEELVS